MEQVGDNFERMGDAVASALAQSIQDGRDELTPAEATRYLEEQTLKYLSMSLAEFLSRAEAGTLPSHPVVQHLVLISGARPGAC